MPKADPDQIQRDLKQHIEAEILLRNEPLAPHEDLFDAGFDSMSLIRTLDFIEKRFGLTIPDEEVVLDEVSTVEKLARFVHGRLA